MTQCCLTLPPPTRRQAPSPPARRLAPRSVLAVAAALAAAGCWKDDLAEVPVDVEAFQPEVKGPRGWVVTPFETDLQCPDGEYSKFYLLHPEKPPAAPMAAAVLYHGGSFDFVYAPDSTDLLGGTHFVDPSRLGSDFASRQVFATLGMYPDLTESPVEEGLVATAFAERDVVVMLPANCWGDLWANKPGGADNSFVDDFFFRQGRAAAEWSYRFLVDPLFAAAFDVELPVQVDPTRTFAVGLQEGGRAVGELLHIDNTGDGVPDYRPLGVLVDTSPDDLTPLFADPALYATTLEGLARLYPEGPERASTGSLATAELPQRTGYLHPIEDPRWPDAVHEPAVEAVRAVDGWVYSSPQPGYGYLNGDGRLDLARDAVSFLLDGAVPVAP